MHSGDEDNEFCSDSVEPNFLQLDYKFALNFTVEIGPKISQIFKNMTFLLNVKRKKTTLI